MARKCILCGKEYKYCKNCQSDYKKELWHSLYDTENCKDISKTLTDYKFDRITKDEAREILSKCDLTIDCHDNYRNEINAIMTKPKRGTRAKAMVIDEIIQEPELVEQVIEEIKEEAKEEEPNGVVIEE